MKAIQLVFLWCVTAVMIVIIAVVNVVVLLNHPQLILGASKDGAVTTLADGSGQVRGLETTAVVSDARAQVVSNFLRRHNSPLDPDEYGPKLVAIADKYGVDYRLLPAIAMQESNLCKVIPPGSYNCLGFGIHERGTLEFESYEANFDRAARELKKYYINQGRTTPEEIMRKYTPSSNGSWANSVNQWIHEMTFDDRQKGRETEGDANLLEFVEEK